MNNSCNFKTVFLLLFLFSTVVSWANTSEAKIQQLSYTTHVVDSFIIAKENSSREVVVRKGQKIRIWLDSKQSITGEFDGIEGGKIKLKRNNESISSTLSSVSKVKLFNQQAAQIAGTILSLTGAVTMGFGAIALIAGIVALSSAELGAIIIIVVPPLAFGGFGLYKLGQALSGNKYNLNKKWSIKTQ